LAHGVDKNRGSCRTNLMPQGLMNRRT
jgi:hypothetical protein